MNNQRNLQQILSIVYEVEGLLLLAQSKGNDTPNEIYDLIQEKLKVISQPFPSKEVISDNSELINMYSEPEDERSHGNLEDDYCGPNHINENEYSLEGIDDIDNNPSEIGTDIDDKDNSINLYHEPIESQFKDEQPAEEESIEESDIESIEIESDEIFESIDSETEDIDDDIIELDDNDSYDDIEDDNTVLIEPITIEEKIAIQNTRDLRTAFTINDRFRFKRELFGNKDTELADALNMISAMTSFAEAQEYFFEDLEWDKDNPEVIDFLKIISNYFNNRS